MKINNIVIGILAIAMFTSCKVKPDKIDKIALGLDTVKIDTAKVEADLNAIYLEQSREYNITKDSLDLLKLQIDSIAKVNRRYDSLNNDVRTRLVDSEEKRGVAEYKLLRIREYNRIAAQGNNLKYLRGWIIRTLK